MLLLFRFILMNRSACGCEKSLFDLAARHKSALFTPGAAPFGFKGDDMRQAPPYLGRCMLARIVLEPFGMEPSRRRPCQFISELIFTPVRKPSAGVTRLMA